MWTILLQKEDSKAECFLCLWFACVLLVQIRHEEFCIKSIWAVQSAFIKYVVSNVLYNALLAQQLYWGLKPVILCFVAAYVYWNTYN